MSSRIRDQRSDKKNNYRGKPRRSHLKDYRDSNRSRYTSGPEYERSYRNYGYDQGKLDREDIIQGDTTESDIEYWGYPTIDYDSGEYLPSEHYDSDPEYEPGFESGHRYAHERWSRSRYGMGMNIPTNWTDRQGEYDTSFDAQYPEQRLDEDYEQDYQDYRYSDSYYIDAPDFYRERYAPREDSLKRLYLRMFRNIEYNIKVPFMQITATIALFILFWANYTINFDYVTALGSFSPYVDPMVHPPAVAGIFAAIFGVFLILFPKMNKDIKRIVIMLTIIFLIILFSGPAIIAWVNTYDIEKVGLAFAGSIYEFLKLAAVLVYWAPMFLGIYGIWTRNSFYIGASAMFMFLIIIVLDIYLFYEGVGIPKIRDNWGYYVGFTVLLFCYIEISDSAITFANFTSIRDKAAIDPGYYEHLDKILEKYFVYLILFTGLTLFMGYFTLNFNEFLKAIGSEQIAVSLEMTSVFGTIISLIVISIIILFIGLFIRYEDSLKKIYYKLMNILFKPKPTYNTLGRYNQQSSRIRRRGNISSSAKRW